MLGCFILPVIASKVPAMPLREKAHLMTGTEINRTIVHLAHEIIDKTEALKSQIEKLVKQVKGVKSVDNQVTVG